METVEFTKEKESQFNGEKHMKITSNRTLMGITVVIVLVVLGIGLYWSLLEQPEKYTGPVEKVTIGISATSLLPSLVLIAKEKGYFLEQGIDMEIKDYPTGKAALSATLKEEVDMGTVADVPVVFASFERNDFAILATIVDSAQHAKALARKDRNINTPQDLIGKKVATTIGTTAHFFMVTFFALNLLDFSDVQVVDLKPNQMVQAIVNGDVDAIFAWEPNILNSQEILADNAVILPSMVGYMATFNLVSRRDFIENNPELIKRIIKSLAKAEEFVKDNREESVDIVASRLKIERESVNELWNDYKFRLSLSQSLLVILEDQARWAIQNNLIDATGIPNYFDAIYLDALLEIRPGAVGIVH